MPMLIKPYSKYHLYRWSLLIRERDGNCCYLCKRQCLTRREIKAYQDEHVPHRKVNIGGDLHYVGDLSLLLGEAHHIRAKFHYPHLALKLDNGVTLCWRCHRHVVHSTYHTFEIHIFAFRMYTLRNHRTLNFNANNQHRVQPRRKTT